MRGLGGAAKIARIRSSDVTTRTYGDAEVVNRHPEVEYKSRSLMVTFDISGGLSGDTLLSLWEREIAP